MATAPVDAAEHYATKADLGEIRGALPYLATKSDIAEVNAGIAAAKADLYRALWLAGLGIVTLNVTLTTALVKLL